MSTFEETIAEVGALRQLIEMVPEENCIDRVSLWSRMSVVLQKAILNSTKNVARTIRTPPKGFSDESEPTGMWWTVDAERAVEELVKLVELAQENGVGP